MGVRQEHKVVRSQYQTVAGKELQRRWVGPDPRVSHQNRTCDLGITCWTGASAGKSLKYGWGKQLGSGRRLPGWGHMCPCVRVGLQLPSSSLSQHEFFRARTMAPTCDLPVPQPQWA